MNIFELEATLPNGLHDTEVSDISVSYERRSVLITCEVFVGEADAPPELREAYRAALIECHGVQYCIMDRPDPRYLYCESAKLTVDLNESDPNVDLPGEGHSFRLWVGEWNGFIHIRAVSVSLTWRGDVQHRSAGG